MTTTTISGACPHCTGDLKFAGRLARVTASLCKKHAAKVDPGSFALKIASRGGATQWIQLAVNTGREEGRKLVFTWSLELSKQPDEAVVTYQHEQVGLAELFLDIAA